MNLLSKIFAAIVFSMVCVSAASAQAQSVDLYQHWLLASCSTNPPERGTTAVSAAGVGVTHRPGVANDVVIYCPIDAGPAFTAFNWLALNAEDNTTAGYATATVYRQEAAYGVFSPPVALYSVTTFNQAGVQEAGTYVDPIQSLDDTLYMYWIEVRIHRTSPSANITVYAVSLTDVL